MNCESSVTGSKPTAESDEDTGARSAGVAHAAQHHLELSTPSFCASWFITGMLSG